MNESVPAHTPHSPGIQVIARAAAVLRVLRDSRAGLSLSQIAGRVELPRSTVQRIIQALLAERLVMQVSSRGGFRLGPEIQALAVADRDETVEVVRPVITDLSLETGETVDLAEFRQTRMVFVDQVVGTHRLRTAATVGEPFPLTCTANGKACLALLDDATVVRLAAGELAGGKSAVVAFVEEVARVRREGIAYDLDEHTRGISAVGASFESASARIYAVSIPVPTPRFAENRESLTRGLGHAMHRIRELMRRQ